VQRSNFDLFILGRELRGKVVKVSVEVLTVRRNTFLKTVYFRLGKCSRGKDMVTWNWTASRAVISYIHECLSQGHWVRKKLVFTECHKKCRNMTSGMTSYFLHNPDKLWVNMINHEKSA
jgi:hypothetical protein